jgi:hypothetical protein
LRLADGVELRLRLARRSGLQETEHLRSPHEFARARLSAPRAASSVAVAMSFLELNELLISAAKCL